jgi:hypothetical protein
MISSLDKVQRRKIVIETHNTAQDEFELSLKSLSKTSTELTVTRVLRGHVNLAVLVQKGFSHIENILFQENGDITSIVNIPEKVKILECKDNLLEELSNLPESLEELRVSNNIISSLDLSKCKKLLEVYVSFNHLSSLKGFAETLRILHCDHNDIVHLDLSSAIRLRTLYCHENQNLVLENLPETIVDGKYPTRIVQEHRKSVEKISTDYIVSLKEYFKIKGAFEEELRTKRKKNKNKNKNKITLPKCRGCEKPVGMVFSRADGKYQARCNGNPPCEWNIVLHRGTFHQRNDVLYTCLDDVEEIKENVIKQKMATLFHHMGEKKATELFEQQMKAYTTTNSFLAELKEKQDELYFNVETEEKMKLKQIKINDALERVKTALREDLVEDAVEIQYKEIFPLSQAIQKMQYEVMELVHSSRLLVKISETDDVKTGQTFEHYLVQEPLHFTKLEINLGEAPSVGS